MSSILGAVIERIEVLCVGVDENLFGLFDLDGFGVEGA
mgnify:CR=1 FL=1